MKRKFIFILPLLVVFAFLLNNGFLYGQAANKKFLIYSAYSHLANSDVCYVDLFPKKRKIYLKKIQ